MAGGFDMRVMQANERTLLSWVRTALALMALGFVIERLAVWIGDETGGTGGRTAAYLIGAATVGLGALSLIVGTFRYLTVRRALIEDRAPPSGAVGPVLVALVAAAIGIALIAYVLFV